MPGLPFAVGLELRNHLALKKLGEKKHNLPSNDCWSLASYVFKSLEKFNVIKWPNTRPWSKYRTLPFWVILGTRKKCVWDLLFGLLQSWGWVLHSFLAGYLVRRSNSQALIPGTLFHSFWKKGFSVGLPVLQHLCPLESEFLRGSQGLGARVHCCFPRYIVLFTNLSGRDG